jgi:GTPase SAR1 family protein
MHVTPRDARLMARASRGTIRSRAAIDGRTSARTARATLNTLRERGVPNERRRSILVWGPSGSGKSLYLASLVMWLTRVRDEPPFAILPADDATARWIAARGATHPDGLAVASATRPERPALFHVYAIGASSIQRSQIVAEITVSDAGAGDRSPAGLDDASGIMLLLPVDTMAASAEARDSYVSWLTTTLARLPAPGSAPPAVTLPVAVCLTQTDTAPDAVRRDPTGWLESFGSETVRALRAHCACFEVFKVSSLGRTPDQRDGVAVVVGGPEPRGVLAPIRWILEQHARAAEAAA